MFLQKNELRDMRKFLIIGGGVIALLALAGWLFFRSGNLKSAVESSLINTAAKRLVTTTAERDIIPTVLGFDRPRTYLVLFLNNTELRPGGGFIGAYAVVTFEKGIPRVGKVEGTEIIDQGANPAVLPDPPDPLKEYLKVQKWYFRDSNWSPDFASSSAYALDLFRRQHGFKANEIDGVIGFTPTVISELLKITGPLTAAGQTFTSENFTERLEYEVEYGYAKRGIDFDKRKAILGELGASLLSKIKSNVWRQWNNYLALGMRMLLEKQLIMYSPDQTTEQVLSAKSWDGKMKSSEGDYLLWVDANLGALKTDVAIERKLFYRISPTESGFVAEARMRFAHLGSFDWRTTRYRDYVRVYVPIGSSLVKMTGGMKTDKSLLPGVVSEGIEHGRKWFGTFISIEPGKTAELSFQYTVDKNVAAAIARGDYNLMVQKQVGTAATPLTLGLDFGTRVESAHPGERPEKHGDARYDINTDLIVDRDFSVYLTH